jgi:hypothetical protein
VKDLLAKVIALLDSGLPREVLAEVLVDVVARSLGRLGGRPRNGTRTDESNTGSNVKSDVPEPVTKPQNGDLFSGSGSDPSPQDPDTSQPIEEIAERDEQEPPGFLEFWGLFPKKVGKAEARRAWKRRKPPIIRVRVALAWQVKSRQWLAGYVPNPATYINQGRWDDEPLPVNGSPRGWSPPSSDHGKPGEKKL